MTDYDDFKKSIFKKAVNITRHVRFPIHM